ncbi:CCD81 protein, partial [Nothocercus julius]|nr:CCD81 protein [Nothocercus julius]
QGVLLEGLGTFCTVQEPLSLGAEEVLLVRRPIFKLGMQVVCAQGLPCPEVTLPDDMAIEPLNYLLLSLVTSWPRCVLEACVEETIRLFTFHVENKQNVAFDFADLGVLTHHGDTLCMSFYASCVTQLQKKRSLSAALGS